MALWTPADIASGKKVGWFDLQDAAAVTSSGGLVSQLQNKFGTTLLSHLTQATGASQPAYSATSFNSAYSGLTTVDDYLTGTVSGLGDNLTIIIIAKNNGAMTNDGRVFSIATASTQDWEGGNGNGMMFIAGNEYLVSYANGNNFGGHQIAATPSVWAVTWAATSVKRVNGTVIATNTPGALAFSSAARVALGNAANISGEYFTGIYAEVVILKDATLDDIEKIEGYAMHRRSLQSALDASHPYKTTAPQTASSDVTGTLDATETGSDTASFTGTVTVSGSLAATEAGSDTASFSGSVTVTGSLAATEAGSDTADLTGSVTPAGVSGYLDATEDSQDDASFTGTTEGGEIPTARQPDGDALAGKQFKAKRSRREDDPRSSMQRLVDRFLAAKAKPVEQAPKAIKAAVKAAEEAKDEIVREFAPVVAPTVLIQWDAALEDLRQAQEQEQQAQHFARALEMLREMQRQAQEADDEEEELIIALLAA